jgi:hypothetical protein
MTRRTHHARELTRVDGSAACFAGCGRASGWSRWSYSAYCQDDQVYSDHEVIGTAWMCPRCHRQFGTCTDFDRHQRHHPKGHPEQSVYTGECIDPATFGDLMLVNGVWLTEAGHRKRTQAAANVRAAHEARRSPLEGT